MTSDADVFVGLPDGRTLAVGHLAAQVNAGGVLVASRFQYAGSFLRDPSRYELRPELPLTQGPITAMGAEPWRAASQTPARTVGAGTCCSPPRAATPRVKVDPWAP